MKDAVRMVATVLAVLCLPYLLRYFYSYNIHHKLRDAWKAQLKPKKPLKSHIALGASVLPTRRPRALTLPLPPPEDGGPKSEQRTECQAQSAFFTKLPLEVRRMIYEALLGCEDIEVVLVEKFATTNVKLHTLAARPVLFPVLEEESPQTGQAPDSAEIQRSVAGGRGFIPLLQTCRRVYSEAIETLYTRNTFDLADPKCIIQLSTLILPQRLNVIRSVRLHDYVGKWRWRKRYPEYWGHPPIEISWERVCRTLADMRQLRRLSVRLGAGAWYTQGETYDNLLAALKAVRQPREFVVEMPAYHESRASEFDEVLRDAPFVVKWAR